GEKYMAHLMAGGIPCRYAVTKFSKAGAAPSRTPERRGNAAPALRSAERNARYPAMPRKPVQTPPAAGHAALFALACGYARAQERRAINKGRLVIGADGKRIWKPYLAEKINRRTEQAVHRLRAAFTGVAGQILDHKRTEWLYGGRAKAHLAKG